MAATSNGQLQTRTQPPQQQGSQQSLQPQKFGGAALPFLTLLRETSYRELLQKHKSHEGTSDCHNMYGPGSKLWPHVSHANPRWQPCGGAQCQFRHIQKCPEMLSAKATQIQTRRANLTALPHARAKLDNLVCRQITLIHHLRTLCALAPSEAIAHDSHGVGPRVYISRNLRERWKGVGKAPEHHHHPTSGKGTYSGLGVSGSHYCGKSGFT